jgi:hypothetical protein
MCITQNCWILDNRNNENVCLFWQMNGKAPKGGKGETSIDCEDCSDFCQLTTAGKMRALLQKNFLRMWRNVGWVFLLRCRGNLVKCRSELCNSILMVLHRCCRVMLFIFALPVMQVILFCLAIGRDPTGLRLAIVNHELNESGPGCQYSSGCSFRMLSCRYLQNLNNESIVKVRPSSCTMTSSFLFIPASPRLQISALVCGEGQQGMSVFLQLTFTGRVGTCVHAVQ